MKALMPSPFSEFAYRMDRLKGLPDAKGKTDDHRLREASNEFEAIFIQQMLKTMRKTSLESEFIRLFILFITKVEVLTGGSPEPVNVPSLSAAFWLSLPVPPFTP